MLSLLFSSLVMLFGRAVVLVPLKVSTLTPASATTSSFVSLKANGSTTDFTGDQSASEEEARRKVARQGPW